MAALFFTTLIHELGHCWGARSVGGHADEILLWPLGGMAFVGHGGPPRDDIKVAVAGPAMHLPMALLCVGMLYFLGIPRTSQSDAGEWNWLFLLPWDWIVFFPFQEYFWQTFWLSVLKIQVLLFLFNLLLPAYPLDGGRILSNLFMMRYGRERAAIMTTYFSIPIGIALVIWAFVQRELLIAFIGGWVLFEAWQIHRLVRMHSLEAHPMFGGQPEFNYMPEPQRKPGFFARWSARRAQKASRREANEAREISVQVDAVLILPERPPLPA